MTCIVGLVDGGKVYIGGDSAGVADYSVTVRADKKVFANGEFIFGFTSSFRMGQLIQYAFTPPKRHADQEVMSYMVTTFIDAIRACFKSAGWMTVKEGVEEGGRFLVGYQGRLFMVDGDFQIGEPVQSYMAVGCGQDIALGAMFVSAGVDPEQRINKALAAATEFSAGVRGPYFTVSN